jgi:hypothetical protein
MKRLVNFTSLNSPRLSTSLAFLALRPILLNTSLRETYFGH